MIQQYSGKGFDFVIHKAKKKGLFNYGVGYEILNLDRPIPDFALLKDVFLQVIKPPLRNEDPADVRVRVGVFNGEGVFVGGNSSSAGFQIAVASPGKQYHVFSLDDLGACFTETVNGIKLRKDYFFNGSGMSNIQINFGGPDQYDNEDFEVDICFLCLEQIE